MNPWRVIQSESIKLKYLPIFWLCGFVLFAVLGILIAASWTDGGSIAMLGTNPWGRISIVVTEMFSVFMAIPLIVLLVSAGVYIEHQSNAWKYQYTAPMSRAVPYYGKLVALLLVLVVVTIGLCAGWILCGYILDAFFPEMEFTYYAPPIADYWSTLMHTFLALLSVFALQYFLSYRFKGFLIPASLGIICFVIGIILGISGNPLAIYFPYSHPIMVQEYAMFRIDRTPVVDYGWVNNVQIFSFLYFVFFIAVGHLVEVRRNVS